VWNNKEQKVREKERNEIKPRERGGGGGQEEAEVHCK
jgi:hypothetical protein